MAFCWRADYGPTLNAGSEALWFFGESGLVLLRNRIDLWFFRGARTSLSPLWRRPWTLAFPPTRNIYKQASYSSNNCKFEVQVLDPAIFWEDFIRLTSFFFLFSDTYQGNISQKPRRQIFLIDSPQNEHPPQYKNLAGDFGRFLPKQTELNILQSVKRSRILGSQVVLQKREPKCDNILIASPFVRNLCLLKRKIINNPWEYLNRCHNQITCTRTVKHAQIK